MSTAPEGISRLGSEAEQLYRRYTGAQICPRSALGDAMLEGHYVEVKRTKQTTINQVRAVKYIPLVVYSPPSESWYVVSPDEIVRLVAKKTRGQHTENPFESATLTLRDLGHSQVASPEGLRQATLDAIGRGDAEAGLKAAMSEILKRCKELANESLELVRTRL